jgi:hypothetical protein
LGRLVDDRFEIHMRQNVPLQINPGSDLHQFQALFLEPEDTTLGNVEHRSFVDGGISAAEGFLFNLRNEFPFSPLLLDLHLPVRYANL